MRVKMNKEVHRFSLTPGPLPQLTFNVFDDDTGRERGLPNNDRLNY
jgi:hypothetical protein